MLKPVTITGPSHWASYLVNDDASGLTPDEKSIADAWLAKLGNRVIVSTVDDAEPRFTWYYRLYTFDLLPYAGGEVVDYIALEGDDN